MVHAAPEISGSPAEPGSLCIELIRRRLTTVRVGGHIYLFGRIASTTEVLGRLAAEGASDGTVVVADDGTTLGLSVLFRLEEALEVLPALSFLAARALRDALGAAWLPAVVRVECATVAHCASWAILGIGANLGSIAGVTPQRVDRNAFAAAFLNALDRLVATFAARGASAVLAGWRDTGGFDARE